MAKISITGTLEGMSRKEAAALIESVGCEFAPSVTYETNYLVATVLDSNKAKKAQKIGVDVITQAEFEEFIEAGSFPENRTPDRPSRLSNFPDIPWVELPERENAKICYADTNGEITDREITIIATGQSTLKNGRIVEYLQVLDLNEGGHPKTLRKDRILSATSIAS